MKMLCVISRP